MPGLRPHTFYYQLEKVNSQKRGTFNIYIFTFTFNIYIFRFANHLNPAKTEVLLRHLFVGKPTFKQPSSWSADAAKYQMQLAINKPAVQAACTDPFHSNSNIGQISANAAESP